MRSGALRRFLLSFSMAYYKTLIVSGKSMIIQQFVCKNETSLFNMHLVVNVRIHGRLKPVLQL